MARRWREGAHSPSEEELIFLEQLHEEGRQLELAGAGGQRWRLQNEGWTCRRLDLFSSGRIMCRRGGSEHGLGREESRSGRSCGGVGEEELWRIRSLPFGGVLGTHMLALTGYICSPIANL